MRHGWLSFWQGAFFASVLSERETGRSGAAGLALGRVLAAQLPDEGRTPAIVSQLPPDGLQARDVRFLRHPQILNTHVFIDEENLLGLGPASSAALGRYVRGEAIVSIESKRLFRYFSTLIPIAVEKMSA